MDDEPFQPTCLVLLGLAEVSTASAWATICRAEICNAEDVRTPCTDLEMENASVVEVANRHTADNTIGVNFMLLRYSVRFAMKTEKKGGGRTDFFTTGS